jgi:hypothetical protein
MDLLFAERGAWPHSTASRAPAPRRSKPAHRALSRAVSAFLAAGAMVAAGLLATAPSALAVSSTVMRYPYLTDLTSTSVQVTFDTSSKVVSAVGAVQWGTPVGATGCTMTGRSASSPGNTLNAPITVAGVTEYQTSIRVSGLTAGTTYCYRIYTGGTAPVDLLGADAAPRFTTLSTSGAFTFDVLGDWGDDSVAGGRNQKNVDALIAGSGAQFAVSTGDIAYQNGSQNNYGNLVATGTAVSEVFGPDYWKVPGAAIPLFATTGNHGRSTTFLQNWKQGATVAASGGRYLMETYSGIDSTAPASYPSAWYAFDAGGARFYVLAADWNDSNVGTAPGGAYQVDRDYHWQPSSPQYQWLKADLESHGNTLKLAFFHYPLRADSATEGSDTYLQNDPNTPSSTSSLEGLLANNGVHLAFNGHAHLYQRNLAPPGGLTSYVTGGGGAKVSPVITRSKCSTTDAYAVGWSYSKAAGSACGAAPVPTSDAQVFHFLRVTVNGATVTVTPTDSTGASFDPVVYDLSQNSTPPATPTALVATAAGTTVKLTWAASTSADSSAQDIYRDGRWLATVGPTTTSYVDAAPVAAARYTVRAHDLVGNQSADSTPATAGGGPDTTPPTAPGALTATATGPTSVRLDWTASTDGVGVTGYDLRRGTTLVGSVGGDTTSYTDATVSPDTSYSYTVTARDAAGNSSTPSPTATVRTPAEPGGTTVTFAPVADARVQQSTPTTNYGTATTLQADLDPTAQTESYLKFTVSGLTGTLASAKLRVWTTTGTTSPTTNGPAVHGVTETGWTESGLTWSTRPAPQAAALDNRGPLAADTMVEYDVSTYVTGNGTYCLELVPDSSDGTSFNSREGADTTKRPQLVIRTL